MAKARAEFISKWLFLISLTILIFVRSVSLFDSKREPNHSIIPTSEINWEPDSMFWSKGDTINNLRRLLNPYLDSGGVIGGYSMGDNTLSPGQLVYSDFLVYHIPDSMKLGMESRVNLMMAKNKTVEELKNKLHITLIEEMEPSFHFDSSDIGLKIIQLSKSIAAKLYQTDTAAFHIVNTSTEIQRVGTKDSAETRWEWSVKPLKEGKHKLILKISLIYKVEDIIEFKDIKIYDGSVTVAPVPHSFYLSFRTLFEKSWDKVIVAVTSIVTTIGTVVGGIAWLYVRIISNNERKVVSPTYSNNRNSSPLPTSRESSISRNPRSKKRKRHGKK